MAKTRKSKKNTPSTLPGFWKSLHETAPVYLDGYPSVKKKNKDLFSSFLEEANKSALPGLIYENFVLPYYREKEMKVSFGGEPKGSLGKWAVKINSGENFVRIDPVGLFMFVDGLSKVDDKLKKAAKDGNFLKLRLFSFYKEISKLPQQYFLFISVLREVAIYSQIYAVDSKGAFSNSDAAEYFSLLWALKQFEEFYLKIQIRNLRSDYGLIWHEGEWVDAPK